MRPLLVAFAIALPLVAGSTAHAASMSPISDLIVNSQPSTSTSHTITFTVTNAVPAGGTITISSENAFSIPGGFSVNDVDFAVASGGPYNERDLAAVATPAFDGVSVVTGSAGSITITLNSTSGVSAGDQLRVELGTVATHQTAGSISPVNPATPGGYRVRVNTANGSSVPIDEARAMFIVILPVTLSTAVNDNAPVISNAFPSGTIPAGSNYVELTFETNVAATCKFATSTGITYDSMPRTASNIAGLVHYAVVSGHSNGSTYHYYIRCRDTFGATAQSDYDLSFTLAATPTVTSSDGTTPGVQSVGSGGSGGSGGAGSFAGGSSVLFQSTITISGWAPANSDVSILKDGKAETTVQAAANGRFTANVSRLERGSYTFVMFATDGTGKKTSRFSSTITLNAGTNNAISNVLLSPTIAPESETVDVGASVRVFGVGVPESIVTLLVRNVPTSGEAGAPKEYSASSTVSGTWEITVPARDLKRGTFDFRVKTVTPSASSEYGAPIYVGVGETPSQKADTGNKSDINGDGKVNLVDFSILLTHWNESDDSADINTDGTVNLADFSILLFNWTG